MSCILYHFFYYLFFSFKTNKKWSSRPVWKNQGEKLLFMYITKPVKFNMWKKWDHKSIPVSKYWPNLFLSYICKYWFLSACHKAKKITGFSKKLILYLVQRDHLLSLFSSLSYLSICSHCEVQSCMSPGLC